MGMRAKTNLGKLCARLRPSLGGCELLCFAKPKLTRPAVGILIPYVIGAPTGWADLQHQATEPAIEKLIFAATWWRMGARQVGRNVMLWHCTIPLDSMTAWKTLNDLR